MSDDLITSFSKNDFEEKTPEEREDNRCYFETVNN